MRERSAARWPGTLHQRSRKLMGSQGGRNSDVGYLAELAGSVALAFPVNVTRGSNDKKYGKDAQSKR
jgi:hypothetical protein